MQDYTRVPPKDLIRAPKNCADDLGQQRTVWATLLLCFVPSLAIFIPMMLAPTMSLQTEHTFEQLSGGLLLVTYMYSFFNNEDFIRTTDSGSSCEPAPTRMFCALLGFASGVMLLQFSTHGSIHWYADQNETSLSSVGDLMPYLIGFFTDGFLIALFSSTTTQVGVFEYSCRSGVWPKSQNYLISIILASDNVVTGFTLGRMSQNISPGAVSWGAVFAAAVLGGGGIGFLFRFLCGSDGYLAITLKAMFATSILDGALELLTMGLTIPALVGILAGWILLTVERKLDTGSPEKKLSKGEEIEMVQKRSLGEIPFLLKVDRLAL